ncbi:PLP-dependent aminotransferase family protein [Saxibacter everestensis]|uniref:PLP-dependent aminotransferase family protein n=1 Tax=Saxibacter everestensis TaxID=2909229 RepID=A0ABY8QNQ1_9MICO|nr:PLP-dependent aminotransferase family protein [Brevibacteriaceae bacterium ZFBP1038]
MRHAFPMNLVLQTLRPPTRTAREHLLEQLRAALLSGQVVAGEPMPSTRALATAMKVSRGTVVAVYEELAGEGYVVCVPCSGTFVADDLPAESSPPLHRPTRTSEEKASPTADRSSAVINLSPGGPSTSFQTNHDWVVAWRNAVKRDLPSVPPPFTGDPELRALIADHLRAARGVQCDADDIVVNAGTSDGLGLLLLGLRDDGPAGARIATENPGYPTARRVITRFGATPVPIAVKNGGMDPDELARTPGPFSAVLLTPSHQYPLGGRLPVAARLAMLAWGQRTGAVIIEDDYDSEFRHGSPSLPAIASLDNDRRVVLMGSFSKTLTPWLRCGFLVIPDPELRSRVIDVRATLGQPVSGLVQTALAEFLRGGGLRRHLTRVGRAYAHRRSLVIAATADLAPRIRLDGIEGGLHATLSWEDGRTAEDTVAFLAERGVEVASLGAYYHGAAPPERQGIVFGYGAPTDLELRAALQEIRIALQRQGN